jgi:hypothetical protein
MADAESGSLAASGRPRDYYDGYDFACAVNYEYIEARPPCAGEEDLGPIGDASASFTASRLSAQLDRLNSRLLDGHGASLMERQELEPSRIESDVFEQSHKAEIHV